MLFLSKQLTAATFYMITIINLLSDTHSHSNMPSSVFYIIICLVNSSSVFMLKDRNDSSC